MLVNMSYFLSREASELVCCLVYCFFFFRSSYLSDPVKAKGCSTKMSHGTGKVSYSAGKRPHGAVKVSHGAMKLSHDAGRV